MSGAIHELDGIEEKATFYWTIIVLGYRLEDSSIFGNLDLIK